MYQRKEKILKENFYFTLKDWKQKGCSMELAGWFALPPRVEIEVPAVSSTLDLSAGSKTELALNNVVRQTNENIKLGKNKTSSKIIICSKSRKVLENMPDNLKGGDKSYPFP